MSESKHTPGPWKLRSARNKHYINKIEGRDFEATSQKCYYIQGPKHTSHFVADLIVATGSEFDNPSPGEANARLIAAAPETKKQHAALLDACKKGLVYIQDQHRNDKNWGCCGNATGDYDCAVCKDIIEIEAAIELTEKGKQ